MMCKCGAPMSYRLSPEKEWGWDCLHCGLKQRDSRKDEVKLSLWEEINLPPRQEDEVISIRDSRNKKLAEITSYGLIIKDNDRFLIIVFENAAIRLSSMLKKRNGRREYVISLWL